MKNANNRGRTGRSVSDTGSLLSKRSIRSCRSFSVTSFRLPECVIILHGPVNDIYGVSHKLPTVTDRCMALSLGVGDTLTQRKSFYLFQLGGDNENNLQPECFVESL